MTALAEMQATVRILSNNRTTNTVGTPVKAGMLAKVVKPPAACREANCSRDTVKIRDGSSSRYNRNITSWISSAADHFCRMAII